ncbi:MAG: hypothetical protein ACKVPJ_13865 [Chitinophagales bacterium]
MKNIIPAVVFITLFSEKILADSPLTETYFYAFYTEHEIVNYAIIGTLDDKIAEYLLDDKNLIDVKAAVINAMGWGYEGKGNANLFRNYLAKRKGTTPEAVMTSELSGSELMCLGYLMAMDNTFEVDAALEILDMAKLKMPKSFAINMLWTLVKSQKEFETNFCNVWGYTRSMINNKTLKRDMKTAAIQSVVNYLILYKPYCSLDTEE